MIKSRVARCGGARRQRGLWCSGQPVTIFPIPEAPLRAEFATTTITHAVRVAAGVFAPGDLGELTQYLPFELVDDVLEQTRTGQRRLRELPSRVGVYFLLALGMFPRLGYARVWEKLTAGLAGMAVPVPVGTDALRRRGSSPCTKAARQTAQTRWRTVTNQTSKACDVASGRAGETSSGGTERSMQQCRSIW